MKNILLIILGIIIFSCENESELEKKIAAINTDISVERFDRVAAKATVNDFSKVKAAYPFLFSEKDTEYTWALTKADTLQTQLFEAVDQVFTDFTSTEKEIESLFNHIKYYFPNFKTPRVITTTSYVDYRNSVIVTDSIVLVALDCYLGSDHEFYNDMYKYIKADLKKEHIVVDMAEQYAEKIMYQKSKRTLLDEMIYYGKELYFKDLMIPFKTEAKRISYSKEQLNWAKANEVMIWRYFIEREMLFSSDVKLLSRFINPAPFSKFYLEGIDRESPGRIGRYIGWQIVKAYMAKNDVSLITLLKTSTEEIFNNSKYKPKK